MKANPQTLDPTRQVGVAKQLVLDYEEVRGWRMAHNDRRSWRWDRNEIDNKIMRMNIVVAACGIAATAFAVAQNEITLRDMSVHGLLMDGLKAGSMLLCMGTCTVRASLRPHDLNGSGHGCILC